MRHINRRVTLDFREKVDCLALAVQCPNNLESTENGDEKASPSLGNFEAAGVLRFSYVLIGCWKQTESDCRIEDRQVIKHISIENVDRLEGATNQQQQYLMVPV